MKHFGPILFLFLLSNAIANCQKAANDLYQFSGRIEKISNDEVALIGPASCVSFQFEGDVCEVSLSGKDSWIHHNYVVFELDGKYLGRQRIESYLKTYPIKASGNQVHLLRIFKATEAANGSVIFAGAVAQKLLPAPQTSKKRIEFIGDSITCGMGNDTEVACGQGEWFDQHNAYWAYGSIAGRGLDADVMMSSVSGYGMYRNWNDEHELQPILPDVYENLYLDKDRSKPYDFNFQPNVVSICLGTNDLSDGDGKTPRKPFDQQKYTSNYIQFVKTVYKHSPNARIVLLNSPMVSGDRNAVLVACLKKVIAAFADDKQHKPIALFEFQPMTPKGCGYHPDIEDHKTMAAQLTPFLKKLLYEN